MCILPDGEFIAPFDIAAVKVVTKLRYSAVFSLFRTPAIPGSADHGVSLHYPPGKWVVSPRGPGIHCYYPTHLYLSLNMRRNHYCMLIRLTIPKGAKVFWERQVVPPRGANARRFRSGGLILAASEVLVVT